MKKEQNGSNSQVGSRSHKRKVYMGDTIKYVREEELKSYLDSGWSSGTPEKTRNKISKSLIGNTAWNKGLTAEQDERVRLHTQKSNQTKRERYGTAFPNNNMNDDHKRKISESTKGKPKPKLKGVKRPKEVGQKISFKKMGHEVSQETRQKLREKNLGKKLSEEKLQIKLTKEYLTKKKNNSFNTSETEQQFYETLLKENVNKTIYRQYKDERYPFYCDFYIKEDDLFIELNAHWSHGGRPYDPHDEDCVKKLLEWQEKAKTSKFYENAIQTWTVRDVQKKKCAEENHLNYKTIY